MRSLDTGATCASRGDPHGGAIVSLAPRRRVALPVRRKAPWRRIAAWGGLAAIIGAFFPAVAKSQLLPEQHVFPSSTLAEIQQALDGGGTVYFHSGDYYQVASSTPDLPPTPANPPKGFNVGTSGKDVDIVGLPGPGGERPRIHGGTAVFRIGRMPALGFSGLPVSFGIENLELVNPDLVRGGAALFFRVGIWVNETLGPRSTIRNCRIVVTGRGTDPGKDLNHSGAIWFRLIGAVPPPAGARVDITDNEIVVTLATMGIGLGHFFAESPSYTAPTFHVSGNAIDVAGLRGFTSPDAAILLHGNLSGSVVSRNTIRGDACLEGYETWTAAISHARSAAPEIPSFDITIAENDSTMFVGDFHLVLDRVVTGTRVAGNRFGWARVAGTLCYGNYNRFDGSHFHGDYAGWGAAASGPGLHWFANSSTGPSAGNTVVASKLNGPPYGFDICDQIFDETDDPGTARYDGQNVIPGYERCTSKPAEFMQRMLERKEGIEGRLDQNYDGGSGDHLGRL